MFHNLFFMVNPPFPHTLHTHTEEIPSYRPPFDEHAYQQPSIEEMRALVCNQHFRPTIPERFQKDAVSFLIKYFTYKVSCTLNVTVITLHRNFI